MQLSIGPDASPSPQNPTQAIKPGVLTSGDSTASQGGFSNLLSGLVGPRTLSDDSTETPQLTPELLRRALAESDAGEGQGLPLGRQALVGMLPAASTSTPLPLSASLSLETETATELNLGEAATPKSNWLARLFGLGPDAAEAEQTLDKLDTSLTDLGDTITQLLGAEPLQQLASADGEPPLDAGGELDVQQALAELGISVSPEQAAAMSPETLVVDQDALDRLSDFLHQQLGLNQVETEKVVNALTAWVQNPPQVNLTPEQLAAADTDQWQQVTQLTRVLEELDGQFSDWLKQLDSAGTHNAQAEAAPVLSKELRTLAQALSDGGKAEADGKAPSPAVMMARLLQSVQNSATSGSLPITVDQSRPEQALLLTPATQTSHDVAFNATLVRMARETLSLAPKAEGDSRASALSGAAATSASGDPGQVAQLSMSLSDRPEQTQTLDLRRVDRPMVSAEVGRQLGERIQMMAQGEIKHATIRLDPPELGALDIKVTVQNDQTQVQITSPNPQVREALESQSVRLREILEQQGLNLSNLDVRDQSADSQARGESSGRGGQDGGPDDGSDGDGAAAVDSQTARPMGLVDQFV